MDGARRRPGRPASLRGGAARVREGRADRNPESGELENTSALLVTREAYADSGSEFAVLSQTHGNGNAMVFATPWQGEDGERHFLVDAWPARGSLSDDVFVFASRRIDTREADRDGVTTSYAPSEGHGLEPPWQGFELEKAYAGEGTWHVQMFTDAEASDVPAGPYAGLEFSGFDDYAREILLDDERVPMPGDRDVFYIILPEDGLSGSLDGVDGTFSCAESYCTLVGDTDLSRYIPWIDSQATRFTPADGSQEVMLDIPRLVTPSSELPKANYLAFGAWMWVPEGTTDVRAFDFGVFAGGDDPFAAAGLGELSGSAGYAGKASGVYAEILLPHVESFTADVSFTADFDYRSEDEFSRLTGRVSNFSLESGRPSPVDALSLVSDWGEADIPGGRVIGNIYGGEEGWHWSGGWGGRFFGNDAADPAAHPTAFAGTFGAEDGVHMFSGSFGARKQ